MTDTIRVVQIEDDARVELVDDVEWVNVKGWFEFVDGEAWVPLADVIELTEEQRYVPLSILPSWPNGKNAVRSRLVSEWEVER